MRHLVDSKRPRYLAIKSELLARIERGTWPIGYRLPTEKELEEQYSVSRGTVRQALSELEHEGLLEVRHGSGAYVSGKRSNKSRSERLRNAQDRVVATAERGLTLDEIECELLKREKKLARKSRE